MMRKYHAEHKKYKTKNVEGIICDRYMYEGISQDVKGINIQKIFLLDEIKKITSKIKLK